MNENRLDDLHVDLAAQAPLPSRERGVGEGAMEQRAFAKTLRQNMTDAEHLLWRHLRAHRLNGEKFRRQQPIGSYVVDFVHFGARLIVEADGSQHGDSARASDKKRDEWLRLQGFRVMRFWNNEILSNTDAVLERILAGVERPLSPGPSPASGDGRSR